MMKFNIGDEFVVASSANGTLQVLSPTVYAVRGVDPESGRLWFCVRDNKYEGYDGDFIASQVCDGEPVVSVCLCDSRSSLPSQFTLLPVGSLQG